ncbi:MAG: alpha/beta hydrolase [Dehalococcoidia bacterium]|nr:alpha/beta hydrolase [Dehalococcoidia bacterium]
MTVVSEQKTPGSSPNAVETLTVKVGDDNIFVRKAGTGPPVLLLHGGACDSSDWVDTMVPLSGSYTFYAPDLLGYGLSDRNREGYYLSDFADSTRSLVHMLGLKSPLTIVGHSLGGRVALELAFGQPDSVRKLVLIDTTGFSRLARWGAFLGTMAYWVRKVMGRPQPYPRFMMENGAMPDWICLDRLPELKMPTLIVWNQRDPYYTVKGAIRAQRILPQARLEIMPGYGHAPHRTARDRFNNLLAAFLAEP